MYERIIVPLDGSELAEAVLPHVTPIAAKFGSEIVLIQIVKALAELIADTMPHGSFTAPTMQDASLDAAQQAQEAEHASARVYLEKVAAPLTQQGLKVTTELREGPAPAAVILAVALDRDCDLVAMSTHGRSGLGRALFGSVADDVLRHSPLPLLLIRNR